MKDQAEGSRPLAVVDDPVDVVNRIDVGYDEVSEALGDDPGCDRTIMCANTEDVAG